jgi:hypothetical protein
MAQQQRTRQAPPIPPMTPPPMTPPPMTPPPSASTPSVDDEQQTRRPQQQQQRTQAAPHPVDPGRKRPDKTPAVDFDNPVKKVPQEDIEKLARWRVEQKHPKKEFGENLSAGKRSALKLGGRAGSRLMQSKIFKIACLVGALVPPINVVVVPLLAAGAATYLGVKGNQARKWIQNEYRVGKEEALLKTEAKLDRKEFDKHMEQMDRANGKTTERGQGQEQGQATERTQQQRSNIEQSYREQSGHSAGRDSATKTIAKANKEMAKAAKEMAKHSREMASELRDVRGQLDAVKQELAAVKEAALHPGQAIENVQTQHQQQTQEYRRERVQGRQTPHRGQGIPRTSGRRGPSKTTMDRAVHGQRLPQNRMPGDAKEKLETNSTPEVKTPESKQPEVKTPEPSAEPELQPRSKNGQQVEAKAAGKAKDLKDLSDDDLDKSLKELENLANGGTPKPAAPEVNTSTPKTNSAEQKAAGRSDYDKAQDNAHARAVIAAAVKGDPSIAGKVGAARAASGNKLDDVAVLNAVAKDEGFKKALGEGMYQTTGTEAATLATAVRHVSMEQGAGKPFAVGESFQREALSAAGDARREAMAAAPKIDEPAVQAGRSAFD